MALTITYDGGALGYDVVPTAISLPTRAEMGEVSFGSIPVEDPGAAATFLGHRPVTVAESSCSQPRLFTGYVAQRDIGRSYEHTQWGDDSARIHDMTIVDCNAAAGFRVITGTDGNRPEETWDERLAWIVASDYLSPLIGGDGTYWESHSNPMDAADYRGGFPQDVLNDLAQRFDGYLNWFLFWNPSTSAVELAIFNVNDTIGDSTLTVSNVIGDINGSTCFAPDMVARLAREPDQVYSSVVVNYANGQVYQTLPATATTYIERGTTISRPYTGKASTAEQQGTEFLRSHSVEKDRITCTIVQVPKASAGLVRAGQRMQVRFSHLPGYESFTWMRVIAVTPTPTTDIEYTYDIALELVGMPVAPTQSLFGALFSEHSLLYGHDENKGSNMTTLLCFTFDGDNPSEGFVAEPTIGAIEYVPTIYSSYPAHYYGIKVTTDATVDVDISAHFAGVSNGAAMAKIEVMLNGVAIDSVTQTDTHGSGHFWGGHLRLFSTGIDVSEDDIFTLQASTSGWGGFDYIAKIPSELNDSAHFRVIGTGSASTGGGPMPTPRQAQTTTSAGDPDVDDDSEHGFIVGDYWLNIITGESFILVDSTAGAAVWQSITAGNTAASTVESETTFGITPAVGTDTEYARQDHTHGTPGSAAISALGYVGELLVADVPVQIPVGTFATSTHQTVASTTTAYAVALDVEIDKDSLTHSTVTNNSRIYIEQAGEYSIIVSAIADITSGANYHLEVWLAVDGTPVDYSNTIVQIPTASTEQVLAVAFAYDFTAGQYFEIMYRGDNTAVRMVQTASGTSPTRPASPACIVTVNMEAPLYGPLAYQPMPLLNEAQDDYLYADT